MVATASEAGCLTEDELLELAAGGLAAGARADAPSAEAHLATCATCSALLAAAVRDAPVRTWGSLAGTTLGPYALEAQIGAGGMGAVYRARDARLGRTLAVKVLHDRTAAKAERLAGEARAAAAIEHRAVVGIYDVGAADGIHYVAMELVEGESLRSVLAGGALGVARARPLLVELAEGVAAAHARGVVHRDLKPENLVLTRDGLRILDFGLAKHVDGAALDETEPGTVQGTAGYMAPEQARGTPADARADVFAVGAIAVELVTGQRAFPGATNADRLSATLRDEPTAAVIAALGALAPIVERCLAKEPGDRFQTAVDLAWALRVTLPAAPVVARRRVSRRAVLAGGAAAAAAGVLGYLFGTRRDGELPAPLAKLRPLTHRMGRVFTARFTHGGRRVAYGAAWDADPVQVHVVDLDSGETTVLDLPSADVLAVSARGELAASLGHRFVDHQSARGHLAVVSLAGGVPRPIADDVQDADFAFDGGVAGSIPPSGDAARFPAGALAVVRGSAHGFRIELPLGTELVAEPGWITHARVAPDGQHVAYLKHPQTNDDGGTLMLVDVRTKATRALTESWTSIAGLAWDPGGEALWFTASRDDLTNTLFRVSLAGEAVAVAVPTIGRTRLHDVAADRRALVTADAWRLRAMAGEGDRSMSEISYVSDISADGAQVVIGELGDLEAGNGAYLVPYGGGRALRVGPGFPIAISPSGQRVAANVREATRLVVYATSSGDAPTIVTPGFVTYGRWLDERALVVLFEEQLWRVALGAAPVRLVEAGGRFALDPARLRCAYIDAGGTLHVLDLAPAGAAPRVVLSKLGGLGSAEVCGWLAAPDAIVVRSTTTPLVLEQVNPVTGARTHHMDVPPPLMGLKAVDTFVLHAGGARYAYSYGQEISQLFVAQLTAPT